MSHYYELTKYPRIYSKTYWGAFINDDNRLPLSIIENRNAFIKDFNIKGICTIPKRKYEIVRHLLDRNQVSRHIDHTETYKTKDGNIVIVNSPYSVTCDDDEKELLDMGYQKYEKLYCTSARTYVYVL
jgi:hypothetical protein